MGLDKSVNTFDYPVIDTDCHIMDPPAIFTDYLSKVSPSWKEHIGAGTSVRWPTGENPISS